MLLQLLYRWQHQSQKLWKVIVQLNTHGYHSVNVPASVAAMTDLAKAFHNFIHHPHFHCYHVQIDYCYCLVQLKYLIRLYKPTIPIWSSVNLTEAMIVNYWLGKLFAICPSAYIGCARSKGQYYGWS
jgi:hypothetical protein